MLHVERLAAGYGDNQVLFGVDLAIETGQVATLLGRNGMGKTTTVRALMGLLPVRGGRIHFRGRDLQHLPSHRIARLGLGLVPEGRQIFPTLTVRENLIATAANRDNSTTPWTERRIYELFPRLAERRGHRGHQLSGGEQQMLAIGRALMTNPRLLILDEAAEGLAPLIREEIWRCLAGLKAEGQSLLLIDKHLARLQQLADRHYLMEKGRMVWTGTSPELDAAPELQQRYLGV